VSAEALRALSERLEQMREEERTRISRELHDELGQLLTCIKLDFVTTVRRLRELKTPGDVVDRLQSAVGQIDLGIAMVRRIATGLRPPGLDHRDLAGAIRIRGTPNVVDRWRRDAGRRARHPHGRQRDRDGGLPRVRGSAHECGATRQSDVHCHNVGTTSRQRLILYVSDNGVGIPRARLNRGRRSGCSG
jgi:signal transduction histidine kinase